MLSIVRCSAVLDNTGESSASLVKSAQTGITQGHIELGSRLGRREAAVQSSDSEDERPGSWLLRLGSNGCSVGSRPPANVNRISHTERARHAILDWRLRRPYLIYCMTFTALTTWLLVWNLAKGVQNNWNLPQWKHHPWEEVLEVGIGTVIVSETALTLRVLGLRTFFSSCCCVFDLIVAALTTVSIIYGLKHLGRHGEICEADVPLLLLRFILQPARVFAAATGTYRTRQMQHRVDRLRVDFDCLADDSIEDTLDGLGTTDFRPMAEYG